ncbi:HAD family hydrolase [Xylanimonas protaetiae]|uniref:HAD family phosphatase n=1 Tax=Xylanimonas protaetiae TaxID=2509457 RepID=A0A4P6F2F2_9MICO|nr:HAD family hydrolase [Xylanimonas protaetiae]QAY69396.1 HAD family phosphatase [Xylanimonas protaetiae]
MTDPSVPTPWLVALDIDGTLLHFDDTLSDAVRFAVADVVAAGHHVVLASGRSLVSMIPVAARLGIADGWMVCSNGAVTVRHDDDAPTGWTIEAMVTFDPEPALRRLAERMPRARFAVEDVGVGFRLTELFPEGELDGDHTVVGLEDLWSGDVTRVVVRAPEATNEEFHASVAELGLADVTYAVGWSAWMDIAPLGVTKAAALEKVRAALGVPPERTLAIGDGHNDVEMLRWAARGVAMGDADDLVRAAASESTATITEDGAALTLRTLL